MGGMHSQDVRVRLLLAAAVEQRDGNKDLGMLSAFFFYFLKGGAR